LASQAASPSLLPARPPWRSCACLPTHTGVLAAGPWLLVSRAQGRPNIAPMEKTKTSSLRPKLGTEAMLPNTQAVTSMSSSMSTLNGNCMPAATWAAHPTGKRSRMPPFLPSSPRFQICHHCTSTRRRGQRAYLQAWTQTGIGGGMGEKASEMPCLRCPISPFLGSPLPCSILGLSAPRVRPWRAERKMGARTTPLFTWNKKVKYRVLCRCFRHCPVQVPGPLACCGRRQSLLLSTWCCFGSNRCYPRHKRKSLRSNMGMEDH
jgi:hypothetical protein